MEIRRIAPDLTWPLRHKILWPNHPFDYVKLANDESGIHFGLWQNETLVSIISLFTNGNEAQFRKFATDGFYQSKGYGTMLLQHTLNYAIETGAKRIWCNARKDKANFYERFGMICTPHIFNKEGIEYVVMEMLR